MGRVEAQNLVAKIRDQFAVELDYQQEAVHLREIRNALLKDPVFKSKVAVPEPISELTRGRVLAMEYLPGEKLELALRQRLKALGIDIGGKPLTEWLRNAQKQSDKQFPMLPASPHMSETSSWLSRMLNRALRLLGTDLVLRLTRVFVEVRLRLSSCLAGSAAVPPLKDLQEILRVLLAAHGFQLFFCPYFNADPHPGNILMLPDGRVGLIDFGQCGQPSNEEREALAKLFVALGGDSGDAASNSHVADAFTGTGVKTKHSDEEFLALMPRLMFDKMRPEWFDRDGPLRRIIRQDSIETLPLHLAMAYRTSMLLRGLCLVLQENVSVADEWRPLAVRWLRERSLTLEPGTSSC